MASILILQLPRGGTSLTDKILSTKTRCLRKIDGTCNSNHAKTSKLLTMKIMINPLFCVLALMLNSGSAATAGNFVPREDIRTFARDPKKLAKLRDAVRIVQSRGLDDPTAWFNMACIHGFPPNDPQVPKVPGNIRSLYAQCHRDEYLFFLWHRAYVSSMERLMQTAIKDTTFRLPYWNWYDDPKLPKPFRNEFVDSARTMKNPLFVKDRNSRANQGANIWVPEVGTDFSEDFSDFQRDLNFGEHGQIHVAVGTRTNMGRPNTAARDPVFWLHHANIDRLLMVWLKRDQAGHRPPTTFPTWRSSLYRFPISRSDLWTPTVGESALASMQAMGYEYESTDLPVQPQPQVPILPPVASGTSATPGALGAGIEGLAAKQAIQIGAAATVDLPVARPVAQKLMQLETKQPDSFQAVNIVLADIKLVSEPEGVLSYRVFVNLPKEAGGSEQFKDYFVGNISLFALAGTDGEHQKSEKPVELKFPATKNIAKSVRSAATAPQSVSVSLVPVMAPEATPPTKPVLQIGEVRLEGTKSPE
jgi:tyrosinase